MIVEPGRQLLHYRLVEKIGQGGMGEVWKAVDTSLAREVAVKLLPESFAQDADRRARLEREAKVLASLNHPNIAGIYGLHEADGTHFLAMELVSGQDLARRLEAGPLPVEDALQAAAGIAVALEAAHENGIIHRDLKPANIQIALDGTVKVLDFGLAKAAEVGTASGGSPTFAPTVTSAGTATGVIMGTAAYMSPEQSRGRPLDRRTDIWSFGCVLYEMLTAHRAFDGETISDMLAAILKEEPDWDALPPETPGRVRTLLARLLRKDPMQRVRDIGDARIRIEEALAGDEEPLSAPPLAVPPPTPSRLPWVLVMVFGAIAVAGGWMALLSTAPAESLHVSVLLPTDAPLILTRSNIYTTASMEISPAGDRIVYVGLREGEDHLMLRSLDDFEAKPMPGTMYASVPTFSPDGQWIAFASAGKFRKIAVSGGAPVEITDGAQTPGLSWGDGDLLVYARGFSGGLWAKPIAGGEPRQISRLDRQRAEVSHRWPHVLPGARHVLYTVKTAEITSFDQADIAAVSLESGESRIVLENASRPRFVSSGHLLYGRDGGLFAVPFDPERVEATGTPVPVLDGVLTSPPNGAVHFSVSATGTLAYLTGEPYSASAVLTWADRDGTRTPLPVRPDNYQSLTFSPDGRHLAVLIASANDRIWLFDLERETFTPLTPISANDLDPIWSPDGTRVVYSNDFSGTRDLYEIPSDGSARPELILGGGTWDSPGDWSPDGRSIAFVRLTPSTPADIWILPLEEDREPFPFLDSPASEEEPAFAPNGDWLAYSSDDSGRPEVYVNPFPGPGGRIRISDDGGYSPKWSPDGTELYYETETDIMAVPLSWDPELRAGRAQSLYDAEASSLALWGSEIAPDGRFLMIQVDPDRGIHSEIRVITGWLDALAALN